MAAIADQLSFSCTRTDGAVLCPVSYSGQQRSRGANQRRKPEALARGANCAGCCEMPPSRCAPEPLAPTARFGMLGNTVDRDRGTDGERRRPPGDRVPERGN